MAKVKKVTLNFQPSGSPDVVGYKLYMTTAPADVQAVDAQGNFTAKSYDLGTSTSVDLNAVPGMTTTDGVYNLGITALDDAGNESSMSVISNVPLDFVAPDAPGLITVIRS